MKEIALSNERMAEIALAVVRYWLGETSFRLNKSNETKRNFVKVAEATGVPLAELKVFARTLIDEQVEETFSFEVE